AVAQELFVAASNWSEENNPLIRTTNDLGKHIENLSETYRDSTFKANLIETTKKIVLLTQSIIDYALYIAEHCSDPKLQKHLVEIVERLPTIGVQLKIVCAVKASRPNDLDTETQIITCAKNIMRTVKDTISACESAYLRYTSEPVASHPKLMTLKNKRITKDQNLITDFADLKFVRKIYKIK
ncbi:Vinculin/alpha-catenin, partial [Rozella allomycis CSF55]